MPTLTKDYGVSTSLVGAIGECRVCADLMMRNWHVYRQVGLQNECDLVALKGDLIFRVEVRSGYTRGEKVYVPRPPQHRYDLLAICLPDRIVYEPPLPE